MNCSANTQAIPERLHLNVSEPLSKSDIQDSPNFKYHSKFPHVSTKSKAQYNAMNTPAQFQELNSQEDNPRNNSANRNNNQNEFVEKVALTHGNNVNAFINHSEHNNVDNAAENIGVDGLRPVSKRSPDNSTRENVTSNLSPSGREYVHIAGLLPLTNAREDLGKGILPAVELAIEHVNNDTEVLPNHELKLDYNDTEVRCFSFCMCVKHRIGHRCTNRMFCVVWV